MPLPHDIDAQNKIKDQLLEGEEILWSGRPKPGIKFANIDIFNIPFTIAWCGVVFFIILSNVGYPILYLPCVLAGIYLTIGRFFYDEWERSRTFYALTPNRVIIKNGIFNTTVTSFDVASLVTLDLMETSDGSGTIKLDSESPFAGFMVKGFNADKAPGLEYIADARHVYELILQQKHKERNQD